MKKNNNNKKNNVLIFIIFTIIFIFVQMNVSVFINKKDDKNNNEISYNEFLKLKEEEKIEKIEGDFKNSRVLKVYKKEEEKIFTMQNPNYETFKLEIMKDGIEVIDKKESSIMENLMFVINIIFPVMIFLFLTKFFSLYNSSNSNSKDVTKNEVLNNVKFDDVIGLDEIKEDMKILVKFLKEPESFKEKNIEMPKGVILYGPPGTGKTLLAKAIAGEAEVPFIATNGSDFIEKFVGVGAKRVRDLFNSARKEAPCILFIDEIDSVGSSRELFSNSEQRQTINALLSELDGVFKDENILVICATNKLEDLDPALIRSGRFDKHIKVPIPDSVEDRLKIIEFYSKDKDFDDDVNFKNLAKETISFSPADLKSLINEASLISVKEEISKINKYCLEQAFIKIITKGHLKKHFSNEHKRDLDTIAWHEAGHCLVAKYYNKNVTKVTIVPTTTGAGGMNIIIPDKNSLLSKKDLLENINVLYAGRCAELIYNNFDNNLITTGASNDILRATEEIKNIVSYYGMSDKYKLINLNALSIKEDSYLNDILEISNACETNTLNILKNNFCILEKIALELIEKHTINEEELNSIFKDYKFN